VSVILLFDNCRLWLSVCASSWSAVQEIKSVVMLRDDSQASKAVFQSIYLAAVPCSCWWIESWGVPRQGPNGIDARAWMVIICT